MNDKAEDHVVRGFSSMEVSKLARVPASTLQYWLRTGMVEASLRSHEGQRVTHFFSLTDLLAVRAIRSLREAGCPMQTLRSVKETINERWDERLSEQFLYWDGADLHIADRWGHVRSAVRRPNQVELVFVVVPLSEWGRTFTEQDGPVNLSKHERLKAARETRYDTAAPPATGSGP